MTCTACGEHPKENTAKGFPKAVVEINNPETLVLLRKVVIPASMGDETAFPPAIGKYRNVLLVYEANNHAYLYSSDGIPTLLTSDVATPAHYRPVFSDATWFAFTSSTPLLDQYRRTYYPASSNVLFNDGQESVSVAELWGKLDSPLWDGDPVVLQIPLQEITTLTTNLIDTGFSADSPLLTINVSLGPDNYFERETSEYTITGWVAESTPITFDGKEAYIVGVVRVVENGDTTYSFVVSLTEVEDPID